MWRKPTRSSTPTETCRTRGTSSSARPPLDYGLTWQATFGIHGHAADVVNDDNRGHSGTGASDDVQTSGQSLPRLVVDAQGNLVLIWYDTRRDPADHLLDVFATVSTDGGLTFSPNFRVSDQSFDADAGVFTDVTGAKQLSGHSSGWTWPIIPLAVWTDTRNSNQDIYFASYPIVPPPAPGNDRFEPNDSADTATPVGPDPVFHRFLPR